MKYRIALAVSLFALSAGSYATTLSIVDDDSKIHLAR